MMTEPVIDAVAFSIRAKSLTREDRLALAAVADAVLRQVWREDYRMQRLGPPIFGFQANTRALLQTYYFGSGDDDDRGKPIVPADGTYLLDHNGSMDDIMQELCFYSTLLQALISRVRLEEKPDPGASLSTAARR